MYEFSVNHFVLKKVIIILIQIYKLISEFSNTEFTMRCWIYKSKNKFCQLPKSRKIERVPLILYADTQVAKY